VSQVLFAIERYLRELPFQKLPCICIVRAATYSAHDRKERKYHLFKTRKQWLKKDRAEKWGLVVKRKIDLWGMVEEVEIEIRSSGLAKVLAEVFRGVRGVDFAGNPPSVSRFARLALYSGQEWLKLTSVTAYLFLSCGTGPRGCL